MTFESALAHVFAFEGGYANNAADPGGPTNYGVTQDTYDVWRDSEGLPRVPVKGATRAEAASIYQSLYWRPSGAHLCERYDRSKLALCTFDWGVNGGVARAVRYLQFSVDTKVDGVLGAQSEMAIATCDEVASCAVYLEWRARHYWARCGRSAPFFRALTEQGLAAPAPSIQAREFLHGWLVRLRSLARVCEVPVHPLYAKDAHLREAPPGTETAA